MIPAFFVVTIQNAVTLIRKAFHTTGRVIGRQAPRRIRQNTRHFIEIMLPRIPSLSEFFSFHGLAAFNRPRRSGQYIWRLCSQQQARARLMLQGDFEEMLYPCNAPSTRFTRQNIPPLCAPTCPT